MEQTPPVPPRNPGRLFRMADLSAALTSSGSKRKRHTENKYDYQTGESDLDVEEFTEHTPKRSRGILPRGDASASEDNIAGQPRLVRKKGSRNLSNLNLRHAARTQNASHAQTRESKFQEGSLTDKPSQKPPTPFTRLTRGDRDNLPDVDGLMENYHETPRGRLTFAGRIDESITQHLTDAAADSERKDEGRGIFHFGRQLAANFRPIALWKTLWNQSKEELIQEDIEREARKAMQKAEAEAKYAEMKQAGLFGMQRAQLMEGGHPGAETTSTPQDSAVALDAVISPSEQIRSTSTATQLIHPVHYAADAPASKVNDSQNTLTKGLKDRLSMKKPSLSNLHSGLKRMRSDINLAVDRESSSSMSPVKGDFGASLLRRSASKVDLKKSATKLDPKKQYKLSKRVSDLEHKLQQARKELDEALIEASPMPKLTGKYERFTPYSSISRPKFQPGKLPSLPSERILMAEEARMSESSEGADEAKPRKAMDLTFDDIYSDHDGEEEETIKASRARPYPARAASLFNLKSNETISQDSTDINDKDLNPKTFRPEQHNPEATENMDPNSVNEPSSEATPSSVKSVDYATLDAKLKQLDANVKTARKAKQKKRKSAVTEDDKTFKPTGIESDEDLEWEKTPKKKQRKNEASPPNKRAGTTSTARSPPTKGKTSSVSAAASDKKTAEESRTSPNGDEEIVTPQQYSADEQSEPEDVPGSIDVSVNPLDPVYEEEEEAPAGATSNETQARSPVKVTGSAESGGVEDEMMMRAARAAQENPARQGSSRNISPPPAKSVTKIATVIEETVTVVPGKDGVPPLPNGTGSGPVSDDLFAGVMEEGGLDREHTANDQFVWPDDVF